MGKNLQILKGISTMFPVKFVKCKSVSKRLEEVESIPVSENDSLKMNASISYI